MSLNTWNFQTHLCRDDGPASSPRADTGAGYLLNGPLPFTNAITGIFSFYIDSNYTAQGGETQYITSIGRSGGSPAHMGWWVVIDSGGDSKLWCRFNDGSAAADRYFFSFGDDDGTSWLQFDKWYQVAFAASSTGFTIKINGSDPKTATTTNSPGSLNLDFSTERWWHLAPSAAWGFASANSVAVQWPSLLVGPSAWDASALDLTSQSVLDRIFDSEGNLKHPGENGSLWFNDSYQTSTSSAPDEYMPNGTPMHGGLGLHSFSNNWEGNAHSSSTANSVPGGLRKAYE